MRKFLHALAAFLVALSEVGKPQGGYTDAGNAITTVAMLNGSSLDSCPGCRATVAVLTAHGGPGALCTTCSCWWAPLPHRCTLNLKREPDLLS